MPNVFAVANDDLERLDARRAVEIFRDLLWADAHRMGLPVSNVSISSRINVPDGGVDANVVSAEDAGNFPSVGVIKPGQTSYQIKTGSSFRPHQLAEIKAELFGGDGEASIENLRPGIRACMAAGGTYVLVCFGQDPVDSEHEQSIQHVKAFLSYCGYSNPQVEVWGQAQLLGFVSFFPSLALRINGREHLEFRTHGSWSRQATMGRPFVSGEQQAYLIAGIQQDLRLSDRARHIRVVGEAGMGKTRLVLEATRAVDLAGNVLYCDAERFVGSNLMNDLLREDNRYSALLVLDECDQARAAAVWNDLQNRGGDLKLVTVSNEFARTSGTSTFFETPPLASTGVSEIIQGYNIPVDTADRWSPYCSGYPRVAHVIGANLLANPEDMLSPPDTVDVWRRFLTGGDDFNSIAVGQRRVVLGYLSLFMKFGYSHAVASEGQAIAAVIAHAEPNITWDRFQEIVSDLRQRKILQGAYTLYITPKLFHLYLWAEWWNTHATHFNLQEFLSQIPPRLMKWFFEMFEYAQTSPAVGEIVRQLLGPTGPFGEQIVLNTELGGTFFLALSKADPGAALSCLRRTIGAWSRSELLEFKSGRRSVVWALENIVVWRGLFLDAARLLLKLAEAESEHYSNNASGIFVDLFSLGFGEIAPTEASPTERLPVLREALVSDSAEIRSLGFKACEKALENPDHMVRTINTSYVPLYHQPNRWTPVTYEEWFDAYRQIWRLVESQIEQFSEADKRTAAQVLVNGAYGIGMQPVLHVMIIGSLRLLLSKGYLEKVEILEFLSQFLRVRAIRGMRPEVKAAWELFREEVTPTDFPTSLKRYVALNLLTDSFDENEQLVDQAKPHIEDLARQVIESPLLLDRELEWLTTRAAQRGFDFGYALGTFDRTHGFGLLHRLIEAQRETCERDDSTAYFLGGYMRAFREADETAAETTLDAVSEISDLVRFVPELTYRMGVSERGGLRIIELAETDKINFYHFRIFEYGLEILKISESAFERIIRYLIDRNLLDATSIGLHLMIVYYLHTGAGIAGRPPLPEELTFQLLSKSELFHQLDERPHIQMLDWNWGQLAGRFGKLYEQGGLKLGDFVLDHFGGDGPLLGGLREYLYEFLNSIARRNPIAVWTKASQYLGPPVDVRAWHLRDWLFKGGIYFGNSSNPEIRTVPIEVLWNWVDEDVDKRAWIMAGFVSSALFRNPDNTCVGREVLIRYGDREDVRRNLGTAKIEFWMGSGADHFQSNKQILLDYRDQEDHPNVLRWIDEQIASLDHQIQMDRIREEREY